jgi:hypothetical protein
MPYIILIPAHGLGKFISYLGVSLNHQNPLRGPRYSSVFRCVLGSEGCVLVPRSSGTPVATWLGQLG